MTIRTYSHKEAVEALQTYLEDKDHLEPISHMAIITRDEAPTMYRPPTPNKKKS